MSCSILFLTAGIVVMLSTVALIIFLVVKGGKEDMGAEFYANYFVVYVRRRKMYTANIHSTEKGKVLDMKIRSQNYVQLQKDVLSWIKEREG